MSVLLTGATGYVGGRLLAALAEAGYTVRCLARRPEVLRERLPVGAEAVRGDLLDPESLRGAMAGVDIAYYLVHSMGSDGDFEEQDRRAAQNFGAAAKASGVNRIVYLGGLGEQASALSPHLRSRHEVGDILRQSGVPVIEFRASIVIGSGSSSFEIVRALVERLPAMVTPRWVSVRAQPMGIEDVLRYLVAAAEFDAGPVPNRTFEIGGPDVVSYGDLMREYARQRGLRRWMVPVPVLTPHLSSLWLGLVTPVYARVGRDLIDSIRHETVVRDASARLAFGIEPVGMREAIARALRDEDHEFAASAWRGSRSGNRLVDSRTLHVDATPAAAFAPIERIGGRTGWYYADGLWTLRGWLDLLVGGVGMRRGRRDPGRLETGSIVDCWRVEALEPGRKLRLAAEMKLPGRAWLEFEVTGEGVGSLVRQTALFDPLGVPGLAYWYLVYPLHQIVFAGMLRGIARAVEGARRSQ
jgi:uncharacterized protein YbjT (DUF2867 family)